MSRNDEKSLRESKDSAGTKLEVGPDLDLNQSFVGRTLLAVVLEGVSTNWQKNVLQVLAAPTSVRVIVDGQVTVNPTAFLISQAQARHLATQITEILGPEPA
jgi:hypothetical protein